MKATLSELLAFLVAGRGKTNSFYPRIINALRKKETPGLGTMGVTLQEDAMVLHYDPCVLEKLEHGQVVLILIHEVLHLALNHIPRFLRLTATATTDLQRRKIQAVANIAMDYAVNSLMVQVHECSRRDLQEGMGDFRAIYPTDVGLPEFKSFDWYLANILKDVKVIIERLPPGREGEGLPGKSPQTPPPGNKDQETEQQIEALESYHRENAPTSNHEALSKEANSMTADQLDGTADKTERTSVRTVRKVQEARKERGTLPAQIESLLEELLAPPEIPWERVLRRYITNTKRVKEVRSRKRPKRRYLADQDDACMFPGKSQDKTFTIVFGIDTSGSMSDDDIEKCLRELQGMQKADDQVNITVLEADARINKEYEITHKSKVDFQITGRGGTSFDPVFIRAQELKPDAVVYATDGYAPLPQESNRVACPVIWVLTPGGCYPGAYSYGYRDQGNEHEQYGKALQINS